MTRHVSERFLIGKKIKSKNKCNVAHRYDPQLSVSRTYHFAPESSFNNEEFDTGVGFPKCRDEFQYMNWNDAGTN